MKFGVVLFAVFSFMVLGSGLAHSASQVEWAAGFPKVVEENVLLQWLPVKGAEEYQVFRGESKGGASKLLSTVSVNRYIDKKPAAGKTYYYKVSAVKGGSVIAASKEFEVAMKAKAEVGIKAPKLVEPRLKEGAGGSVEAGLRWEVERATNLAGYNIYRSQAKGKNYVMVGSSQGTSFTDTDLERGKTYYYVVTAVDDKFNETKYSNEESLVVPKPAAPAVSPADQATKMRRAKLLFTIEKFKDIDGKVKPIEPPLAVKVDRAIGHIYVIAGGKYNGVLVYDMNGRFQFGIKKDGAGSRTPFQSPHGLEVGQNGRLYVSDYSSAEIRVFDGMDGRLKEKIVTTLDKMKDHVKPGRTAGIIDVSLDSEGSLFAADPLTNSVHVFNYSGKQIFDFGKFNKKEKDPTFNGPVFTAIDSKDRYYLVDSGYARVMVYDNEGKYLRNFGGMGFGPGMFNYPSGIAVDKKDHVFVANAMDSNIQAFDADGKFIYAISNEKADGPLPSSDMRGIFVDEADRLYVTESYNHKVSVYQLLEGLVDVIPPQ